MRSSHDNDNNAQKMIIKNKAGFPVYLRVYSVKSSGRIYNEYEPRSEIIHLQANEEIEINPSHASKYHLFYTNAFDQAEAEELLQEDPAYEIRGASTSKEINNRGENLRVEITKFDKVEHNRPRTLHITTRTAEHTAKLRNVSGVAKEKIRKSLAKSKSRLEVPVEEARVTMSREPSGDIPISSAEREFNQNREKITSSHMREIISNAFEGIDASALQTPRAGLCGSGGGYRAMLEFHGFQSGLNESNAMNLVHFVSGTSGSTWAMADIMVCNGNDNLSEHFNSYVTRICNVMYRGAYSDIQFERVKDVLIKALKERGLSAPDEDPDLSKHIGILNAVLHWTAILSDTALGGMDRKIGDKDIRRMPLNKIPQDPNLQPLFIYNMCASSAKYSEEGVNLEQFFDKVEMTHLDTAVVTNKEYRTDNENNCTSRVATKDFGIVLDENGKYSGRPISMSLASLIATCGSAMTFDLKTLRENAGDEARLVMVATRLLLPNATKKIEQTLQPQGEQHGVIFEGVEVNRPNGGRMVLRDAGLDYNLPLMPLLRSDRKCDIVMILDASGDLKESPGIQLYRALQDAKSLGKKIDPKWDNLSEEKFVKKIQKKIDNNKFPIILGNPDDINSVCLIYAPGINEYARLVDNDKYYHYTPETVGTFKLSYDEDELKQLHSCGRAMGHHSAAKLKEVILRRTMAMNPQLQPTTIADFVKLVIRFSQNNFMTKEGLLTFIKNQKGFPLDLIVKEITNNYATINNNLSYVIYELTRKANWDEATALDVLKAINKPYAQKLLNDTFTPVEIIDLLNILSVSNVKTKNGVISEYDVISSCVFDISDKIDLSEEPEPFDPNNLIESLLNVQGNNESRNKQIQILLSNLKVNKLETMISLCNVLEKYVESSQDRCRLLYTLAKVYGKEPSSSFTNEKLLEKLNILLRAKAHGNDKRVDIRIERTIKIFERRLERGLVHEDQNYVEFILRNVPAAIPDNFIYHVVATKRPEMVELALKYLTTEQLRYRYKKKNKEGWNAFLHAISLDSVEIAKMFHSRFPDMVTERENSGVVLSGDTTALIIAVKKKAYRSIDYLCEMKAGLNDRDQANYSPLCWAYYKKDLTAFERLLDEGIDPNGTYANNNDSIFIWACYEGAKATEFVKLMCDPGCLVKPNINAESSWNKSPLELAYEAGDYDAFAALIRAGADPNARSVKYGNVFLRACYDGTKSIKYVELMCSNVCKIKPDVNAKDSNGQSCLVLAYDADAYELFANLIAAGANPNTPYAKYDNLFLKACHNGRNSTRYVELMCSDRCQFKPDVNAVASWDKASALELAYNAGDFKAFAALIDAGANPNAKSEKYGTVFLRACYDGKHSAQYVELMCSPRCKIRPDVNAADSRGQSCLVLAYDADAYETFATLITAGANPNTPYPKYDNLFLKACHNGKNSTRYVELMCSDRCQFKPDVNVVSSWDKTSALEFAYNAGDFKVFAVLIDAGANPNAKSEKYGTVFLRACYDGKHSAQYVELMCSPRCKIKPDVNATDSNGQSCLVMAYDSDAYESFAALIDAGANPNTPYAKYDNLFLKACHNGKNSTRYVELMCSNRCQFKPDVNAVASWDKASALELIYNSGDLKAFEALLDAGANPNAKSEKYGTIFLRACYDGKNTTPYVELMCSPKCKIKPDVNALDESKQSSLLLAYNAGNLRVFELLLAAGADPNIKNIKSTTGWLSKQVEIVSILEYVCVANQPDYIKLLLASGKLDRSSINEMLQNHETGKFKLDAAILKMAGDALARAPSNDPK